MSSLLLVAALVLSPAAAAAPPAGGALSAGSAGAPRGAYVEARSASVFAGACHYGAEFTTQGREAVLAWRFEGGSHQGVDLAGVALACVLAGDRNLDRADVATESVVLLDAAASDAKRAAALDWLRATLGPRLGTVRAVEDVPLALVVEGERFALSAGARVRLAGELLAERECCRMPYQRWYAPLAPVAGAIVGCSRVHALDAPALARRFARGGENDVFVARFGPAAD